MAGFPAMFYASDGRTTIVNSQAEQDALSGAWFESPADFGLITAPSTEQSAALTTEYASGVFEAVSAPTAYAPNAIQFRDGSIVGPGGEPAPPPPGP